MGRRFLGVLLAAALAPAVAPAEGAPRVAFTSTIAAPADMPAACPSTRTEAWPMLAARSGDPRRVDGVLMVGGVEAAAAMSSRDGGRSWDRRVLAGATRCTGGASGREISVNPLVAAGPGGRAYHGQSWVGSGAAGFAYGVTVHALHSGARGTDVGDESGQNAAVVAGPRSHPDRVGLLWSDLDQVPNPFTYAPTGSRVLFTRSEDGGRNWAAPVTVHEPGPGLAAVNTRIVRSGRSLVAVWDVAELADLPAVLLGLPADVSLRILTSRSPDWGRTWSPPSAIGTHEYISVDDPDHSPPASHDTAAGSAKFSLAAGPGGRLALAAAGREDEEGRSTVRLALFEDGEWTAQRPTFRVRGQLIQPEVAFDRDGRLGVAFYDFAADTPGDDRGWEITPRAAIRTGRGWRRVALSRPFDLHATNACSGPAGLALPVGTSCELTVDATAIGVYPSIVGLGRGFGVGHTVGPPVAHDGFTDARFARVVPRRR